MTMLHAILARFVLTIAYGATLVLARVGRLLPRGRRDRSGVIAVTGTFHNRNWLWAHAEPLVASRAGEIVIVTDAPTDAPPGVRFSCPPQWMALVMTRMLAKFVWLIRLGFTERPDLYMGYHIFPSAITALVCGRLFGRPACYQMTAGPIEIEGGGCGTENRLLHALGGASPLIECLATAVLREFDLIVVRGGKAAQFVRAQHVDGRVEVITGGTRPCKMLPAMRPWDMIFVGRLDWTKQPLKFADVVARVAERLPEVRAAVAGDGPLEQDLRKHIDELGIYSNVQLLGKRSDVDALLPAAKVFVLTSRTEGLSIAMAEAMAAGAVPVVSDVGELGDLVQSGVNGYLASPEELDAFVDPIVRLLQDRQEWQRLSEAAMRTAQDKTDTSVVAYKWAQCLTACILPNHRELEEDTAHRPVE